jgi:hypothetical protein
MTGKDVLSTFGSAAADVAVDILKESGNELLNQTVNTVWSGIQNVYNDLKNNGLSVDNAINSIKSNAKLATSTIWSNVKSTVTGTFKKLFSLNTLETIVTKGLDSLLAKNSKLKEICSAFGLKDGKSIVSLGKELFTAVKGLLNGESLIDVLKNSPAIQNAIKNGIKSGINYLVNKYLTPWVNKGIAKVSGWLNKLLGNTLGISESDISSFLTSLYNDGIKWAEKEISSFIDAKATQILGGNSTTSTSTSTTNTPTTTQPKTGKEVQQNNTIPLKAGN